MRPGFCASLALAVRFLLLTPSGHTQHVTGLLSQTIFVKHRIAVRLSAAEPAERPGRAARPKAAARRLSSHVLLKA